MASRKILFNGVVLGYGACGAVYGVYKAPSIINGIYQFEQNKEIDTMLTMFGPLWCVVSVGVTATGWPIAAYADHMQNKSNLLIKQSNVQKDTCYRIKKSSSGL
jgi:hypothetical protein